MDRDQGTRRSQTETDRQQTDRKTETADRQTEREGKGRERKRERKGREREEERERERERDPQRSSHHTQNKAHYSYCCKCGNLNEPSLFERPFSSHTIFATFCTLSKVST